MRRCAGGENTSYYIDHIIECDKLAYDRMLESWKQRGWDDKCTLRRPRLVWASSDSLIPDTKEETYLLYFVVNHGPSIWDIIDWLSDDLGVHWTHFSIWSQEECDKNWTQEGAFLPDKAMPHSTAPSEYDEESENHRKAPEGYTAYEDCKIAVDAAVWREVTVDYTRDEDILPRSPIEELLRDISGKLEFIGEMLGCLAKRRRE